MWPNGVVDAGHAEVGGVERPGVDAEALRIDLVVRLDRLREVFIPNRVSSSVRFDSVEFQTTPVSAACVGSVTELNMSTGPFGGTISPLLPAGADW